MSEKEQDQEFQFNDGLPEILSPTYNHIFKRIITHVPGFMEGLLKSVPGVIDNEDAEVIISDPHQYPENPDGKLGILDIKVVVKSDKIVNVEMQRKSIAHTRERVVYYLSGMVLGQIKTGDDYDKLQRVINIVITDQELIKGDKVYHHKYRLYDPETYSEFTDLLEVRTLELSKLPQADDGSDLWGWMSFFTAETKEDLAMVATKSPVLEEAVHYLLDMSKDAVERRNLERIRLREMDERVMRREAIAEARAEAIAAAAEAKAEIIAEGMNKFIELIEKGYTIDEIKKMCADGNI